MEKICSLFIFFLFVFSMLVRNNTTNKLTNVSVNPLSSMALVLYGLLGCLSDMQSKMH